MRRWRGSGAVSAVAACTALLAACGPGGEPAAGPAGAEAAAPDGPDDVGEDFDPESYFEGKTIRFITSSGAGGGTDMQVRTLASHITKFIPGNPATQVSNVTPHVAGMNYLWNAEPDGLTIALFSAPTLEFEYFEGATWDSAEFEYVGAVDNKCQNMMLMRGDLGYRTIEDAMGSDGPAFVTMAAASTPADFEPVEISTMLVADYLDLPLEIKRVAESGTSALVLALERNEINMVRMGTYWCRIPDQQPAWLEDEFLIPMLDVSVSGPATMMAPGVEERGQRPPHVSEVLTDDQYAQWRGIVAASRAGGTPLVLPPGTPEEIVQAWRDVFDAAFADEDFFEAMMVGWGGSELQVRGGAEAQELFTDNLALMSQYREEAVSITERLFERYVN